MRKRRNLRYAICKRCREKWNIARTQDTSRGYYCPKCRVEMKKERSRNGRVNKNFGQNT